MLYAAGIYAYANTLFFIKNAEQFNNNESSEDELGIKLIDKKTFSIILNKEVNDIPDAAFDMMIGNIKTNYFLDSVDLEIKKDALDAIAQKAVDRKIGARGLRAVMEKIMTSIMFLIPSDLSIKKVVITPEAIEGGEPVIIRDPAHPRQALTGKR